MAADSGLSDPHNRVVHNPVWHQHPRCVTSLPPPYRQANTAGKVGGYPRSQVPGSPLFLPPVLSSRSQACPHPCCSFPPHPVACSPAGTKPERNSVWAQERNFDSDNLPAHMGPAIAPLPFLGDADRLAHPPMGLHAVHPPDIDVAPHDPHRMDVFHSDPRHVPMPGPAHEHGGEGEEGDHMGNLPQIEDHEVRAMSWLLVASRGS